MTTFTKSAGGDISRHCVVFLSKFEKYHYCYLLSVICYSLLQFRRCQTEMVTKSLGSVTTKINFLICSS